MTQKLESTFFNWKSQPGTTLSPEDNPSLDLVQTIQVSLLKYLSILVSIAIPCLWIADLQAYEQINPIDKIGYICDLFAYGLAFILLTISPKYYQVSVLLTLGMFTIYFGFLAQSIIWEYEPSINSYDIGSFMQWVPLIYITYFVFLRVDYSTNFAIAFYLSIFISFLLRAGLNWPEIQQNPLFPYFLQILVCHPVYIWILTCVRKIQKAYTTSQLQLELAQKLAATDVLTQIANRRSIMTVLEQAIAIDRQANTPTAVCLLDLDYFKSINDTYGHDIGDLVLVEIAQLIQNNIRLSDTVGRWGGEEFIIVLPSTPAPTAQALMEQLRLKIAHHPIEKVQRVTASLGLAVTLPNEAINSVINRADSALYEAKKSGRNQVKLNEKTLR